MEIEGIKVVPVPPIHNASFSSKEATPMAT